MPSRVVRRLVGKDTAQQNPCLFDHLVGACEKNIAPSAHSMSAGMLTEVGSLRRPAGKGFALKVQDKACNDVAGLAAAGSSRHQQKIAAIPASASILPRSWHWARAAPPTVAARTRIVSAAGIRLDHRKSVRPFKGIF